MVLGKFNSEILPCSMRSLLMVWRITRRHKSIRGKGSAKEEVEKNGHCNYFLLNMYAKSIVIKAK